MSDQKVMRDGNGRLQNPEQSSREDVATGSIRHTFNNLFHDVVSLTGLQVRLLEIELKQLRRRMVIPIGLIIVGVALMMACVPIGLAGLAFYLVERTELSHSASFFVVTVAGLIVSAVLLTGTGLSVRKRWGLSERSRRQLKQNVQCVKDILKRSPNR